MKVTDPTDDVDLSYAIEELIIEAYEAGVERDEIESVLQSYAKAANSGRYPFNEL